MPFGGVVKKKKKKKIKRKSQAWTDSNGGYSVSQFTFHNSRFIYADCPFTACDRHDEQKRKKANTDQKGVSRKVVE